MNLKLYEVIWQRIGPLFQMFQGFPSKSWTGINENPGIRFSLKSAAAVCDTSLFTSGLKSQPGSLSRSECWFF